MVPDQKNPSLLVGKKIINQIYGCVLWNVKAHLFSTRLEVSFMSVAHMVQDELRNEV